MKHEIRPMENQLLIFKGGTAFNSLIEEIKDHIPRTSYILPISDDGGSSSEIVRVFGGPGIGDIRSTLTRLATVSCEESRAVKTLLEYRLSPENGMEPRDEWHYLLEEKHNLWDNISKKYRALIRGFLSRFEIERLHRISAGFDLHNGSIGNFFFTGARMTFGMLETAIFIFSGVSRIPKETLVVPVIDSNDQLTIGAELESGKRIIGQSNISHPGKVLYVNKCCQEALESPICRLFYINKFGHAILPEVNPTMICEIHRSDTIVYGIGSLWTSIIPSLVLRGVGESIAKKPGSKIVMLNSFNDRESEGMTAKKYLEAIVNALNRYGELHHPWDAYITHLYVLKDTAIHVEWDEIASKGIEISVIGPGERKIPYRGKMHSSFSGQNFLASLNDHIKA